MKQFHCKKTERSVLFLCLLVFVIYSLFYIFTPPQMDDVTFINRWSDSCRDAGNFGDAYANYFSRMRNWDNSRLSNLLFPILCIFSPWKQLFPFIAAGCVVLTILFINSFACKRTVSAYTFILVWASATLFLPWRIHLFENDFALNYVFAGVVSLGAVRMLLRNEKRGWNTARFLAASVVCVVAGAWHEGFAVPTLAGLGILTFSKRMKMTPQWYFLVSIYLLTATVMGLSPGMITRFFKETGSDIPTDYFRMVADLAMAELVGLMMILFLCFPKGRNKLKECFRKDAFIVCFVGMVVSTIISVTVRHSAQTAYYPELLGIICMFSLLSGWLMSFGKKTKTVIASVLFILLLAQSAMAMKWIYKFYRQDIEIHEALSQSSTGTVFYDVIYPYEVPGLTTLYFPSRMAYVYSLHIFGERQVTGKSGFSVIPTDLRHINDTELVPLGNGVYDYRGYLLCDFPEPFFLECKVDYEFSDGTPVKDAYALVQSFITLDGKRYNYMMVFNPEKKKIRSVDKIKEVSYI